MYNRNQTQIYRDNEKKKTGNRSGKIGMKIKREGMRKTKREIDKNGQQ